jgi:glutaminyl-peptide cyclotransferase
MRSRGRTKAPSETRLVVGAALALVALLAACGDQSNEAPAPLPGTRFDARDAFRDLRAQVRIGPRPAGSAGAGREVRLITRRLRAAGLRRPFVQHPYRNVVATIPGREPGFVVAGAHYDTKALPGFVGANDGASGVAVLLELARDLPRRLPGPSLRLVFFDAEESRGVDGGATAFARSGDRGSEQFVRYAQAGGEQRSPALAEIRAMVLFDMVGDCDLRVPLEENSDPELYGLFAAASGPSGPFAGEASGVLDDHTPFADAGIPAVDLIDFDYGPGPSPGGWWHTRQDDLRHVCARSLGAVGDPALAALPAIR